MGTFDVVDKISSLPVLNYKGLEDFVDKMSFIASCILLIACSLIVTMREYVMDPITCYMAHSPGGENVLKFVENYCWVRGTMSVDESKIPQKMHEWKEFERSRIVYYQWVPFMLLFQATLFHLPKILWTVICLNVTGLNVKHLVKISEKTDPEKTAAMIEHWLVQHREYRKGFFHKMKVRLYKIMKCFVISKRFATWLSCGYMLMKCLYLLNSVGQIYLMQYFLQLNNHEEYSSNFGLEIAKNIIRGQNWEITNIFPRVTYCVARLKQLGTTNLVAAQCVLTANLFIEKIYIFLWFWIVLVAIFTSFSLLTWMFRLFVPSRHYSEVKKHLLLHSHNVSKSCVVEKFCSEFLRLDGIFLLYMINLNSGDLVTGNIVSKLFEKYQDKYQDQDFMDDDKFLLYKTNKNCELSSVVS